MDPLAHKKILVVEDEALLRESIKLKLEKNGMQVIEAGDGVDGLQIAMSDHPDLILLDILMPRMDGIEMLHKLRFDDWGKNAKVILLTNLTGEEKVKETQAEGALDYILKSDIRLDDLMKLIAKYTA